MKSIKHCLAIWMLICFKAHQNLFPCTFFNSKMIRNVCFPEKGNIHIGISLIPIFCYSNLAKNINLLMEILAFS